LLFISARYGNLETAGTRNNAGLPNIEGEIANTNTYGMVYENTIATGAFIVGRKLSGGSTGNTDPEWSLKFNASLSNSIYGNSDTVMPPSYNELVAIFLG